MRRSLNSVFCITILFVSLAYSQTSPLVSAKNADSKIASLWTSDDAAMAEQAYGFQISPDNRRVVLIKNVPDKEKDRSVSNLILSSLIEKKEIQLKRGADSSSSPKWLPDGRHIAFTTSSSAEQSKDAAAK